MWQGQSGRSLGGDWGRMGRRSMSWAQWVVWSGGVTWEGGKERYVAGGECSRGAAGGPVCFTAAQGGLGPGVMGRVEGGGVAA
ncbi:hypothetical protein B1218_33530 [Pseudomonas ogarae]|nr:hypothetical protein B1218_33530 [Pseudomonas ogarae]